MENNRPPTGGGNTGTPTPTQGTADRRGATTPFTMAAASGAARRVREQQKALKEALNSSAKTVREREAERQKRKEEEAAAKAAADEKKKREVGEKNQTAEDASMEDPMAMEDSEDDEDNDNRGGPVHGDTKGNRTANEQLHSSRLQAREVNPGSIGPNGRSGKGD